MGNLVKLHSQDFNQKYYYSGKLGIRYTPQNTTFTIWAPTADKVQLHLLNPENRFLDLHQDSKHLGVWSLTLQGDLENWEYRYLITFPEGKVNEFVDPYAVALTANGKRGVVLNPDEVSPPLWSKERMPGPLDHNAISIYELHVRDFTITPSTNIENKGKFLGICEEKTKTLKGHLAGLAYLKSLGVSHIQILPSFDFATIDEVGELHFDAQYNWGYDPANYNVPEGSYSSNPLEPRSRIKEFKQLIQCLHDAGFRVIMDVVYNHVYDLHGSPLQRSVPDYYFRFDESGLPHASTGCGNETASEQPMFRKYMIDSLTFLATTYNLDGFRFDLMGIHDVETMQEVRKALDTIDPNILLLGEGWTMGAHPEGVQPADQKNAAQLPGFSFFNDEFRDALRGSNFHRDSRGFINGNTSQKTTEDIYRNILGNPNNASYLSAKQSVIYSECHDNLTLYDKNLLLFSSEDESLVMRQALALTIQSLSFGIPFFHAGQEIMRTKQGDANSYKSPDNINHFAYDRVQLYGDLKDFFINLLILRKEIKSFNQTDFTEIENMTHLITLYQGHIYFTLQDGDSTWHIAHNATSELWLIPLSTGSAQVRLHNFQFVHEIRKCDHLTLKGFSSAVWKS